MRGGLRLTHEQQRIVKFDCERNDIVKIMAFAGIVIQLTFMFRVYGFDLYSVLFILFVVFLSFKIDIFHYPCRNGKNKYFEGIL